MYAARNARVSPVIRWRRHTWTPWMASPQSRLSWLSIPAAQFLRLMNYHLSYPYGQHWGRPGIGSIGGPLHEDEFVHERNVAHNLSFGKHIASGEGFVLGGYRKRCT